jgi:hypothetical protein
VPSSGIYDVAEGSEIVAGENGTILPHGFPHLEQVNGGRASPTRQLSW